MKIFKFLAHTFFIVCCLTQANAQLLRNSTGFYIDYGLNNNATGGGGYWHSYSNRSSSGDTCFTFNESGDALKIEGQANFNNNQTPYTYVGFLQNRSWWDPAQITYPGFTINMSKPENMGMKIRMKSTGTIRPASIYLKLQDTTGNITLNGSSYFIINPTNEFVDYYFNFNNSWRDNTKGSTLQVVDSSAIAGFDFYVELESPLINVIGLKLEIDYIQLGSFVDWSYNTITGRIFNDHNGDCIFNGMDTPVKKGLVIAQPNSYYAYTDDNGYYELKVDTLTKSHVVSYSPATVVGSLLEKLCPSTGRYTVATPKGNMNYCCKDFAQKVQQCAILKIDINSNRRRRCFTNVTYVNYQNVGNINSRSAEVKVIYPEFVKPISSTPSWTRKSGDTLFYSVGVLSAYTYNTITIIDSVVCGIEDIRFLTQCTQAIITPGNLCIKESVNWDNANVIVKGNCDKGIAKFKILNDGHGDMADSSIYRVYANDTLISNHKFALKSLQYFNIDLPTNGKAIRLEADQVPNHSEYNTKPRISFEGCVETVASLKNATKGIAMNVPQNNDFVTTTSCMQIIDSYDPNDKAVFPKGVTAQNLILAGTGLTYTIRFENTGTDDAYTVVVVDTLDSNLDATTFSAGSSSHPYSIERLVVDGKEVIRFNFKKINLTPKKVDSIKAQGFVTFTISTKPSLADGVTINNEANIFFDYNSAIITNMVSQTIGEYVEEDLAQGDIILRSDVASITTKVTYYKSTTKSVSIYPNPTNENIMVQFSKGISGSARIRIYSISGTLVLSQDIASENDSVISLQQLSQGIYYYTITDSTEFNQNGKIIKQ